MCFNVNFDYANAILLYTSFLQVVENVRVFITDVNDEKPEFLNLPFIVDVPEVRVKISLEINIYICVIKHSLHDCDLC